MVLCYIHQFLTSHTNKVFAFLKKKLTDTQQTRKDLLFVNKHRRHQHHQQCVVVVGVLT